MTTYRATALRWSGGWELHIDGEGVTQVRTLDRAESQVRDYVATLRGIDTATATVDIHVDLGGIEDRARAAKERTAKAVRDQETAAKELRQVARALRAEGLSVSDMAVVLDVSRGRVSQLVKDTPHAA